MHNKTWFGTYLYSAGTHHRDMFKAFVTMSSVTYFIPRAHTPVIAKINAATKYGQDLGTNQAELTGKVNYDKKEILAVEEVWVAIF